MTDRREPPARDAARSSQGVGQGEQQGSSEERAGSPALSQESMARVLGAMLALSGDLIAVTGADGRFVEVNPACERTLGYSAAELRELCTSDLVHPEDRDALARVHGPSSSTDTGLASDPKGAPPLTQHESRMVARDGEVKYIQWSMYPDIERRMTYLLGRDVTEQRNKTRQLERSLHEKEILLKEIHHRIKNNLAIVSQLLLVQLDYVEDPHAQVVLKDSAARVQAIARIHESIYRGPSLAVVNLRIPIERLMQCLTQAYALGPGIVMALDIESVITTINRAVPIALIVNELVTNALNHAFAGRATGRVDIALRREPSGRVVLRVADDGIGIDPEVARAPSGIGLEIVTSLVHEQLGGSWETRSTPSQGTEHIIVFPSV